MNPDVRPSAGCGTETRPFPLSAAGTTCRLRQMNASGSRTFHPVRLLTPVWPPLLLALACLAPVVLLPAPLWFDVPALGACAILCLDIAARYRQYRVLRAALQRARGVNGPARTLFRRARSTWCTRRAALAAAQAEGFGPEARALVAQWGYRPWHVFPDGSFSRRSPFLKTAFWRAVVGLPASDRSSPH